MGAEEPRWYYVGNGELRLKDGDNWTDEFKTIENRRAAVPSQVVGAEAVPQESPTRAGSGGRGLLWLVACSALVLVVGTGAAAANGSLNLGGLKPAVSASSPKAVTASAKNLASASWNGGGFTKADYAKQVGKIPVLVSDVRKDSGQELAMHIDLMSLGFQFDAIKGLPAPPKVDPAWWAATNTKMSQLSQQAAEKWAGGDRKAALARLEIVVKSSNTMIAKVNTAFGIHIPRSKTA
ncbi:MAG: hypothetical protein HHJ11_10890 [Phycicoccus sp.]|nr:hypothetical protein [Phycicoccus sp.]NMM34840.1 hypothetical protein [Phycicoccus sp.]